MSDPVVSGYDALYAAWGRSPTLQRIWREHVAGDDYPAAYDHISFLPLADLRALTDALALRTDDLLVDLACGAGGPGLWAAAETGARLLGIDRSPVAVERATERAAALGVTDRASFRPGTFDDTGLPPASVDAVMSVDALQYAPSKAAAVAELARIVRPGGRVGLVVFELDADRVAGLGLWDDAVGDYRPLLTDAGFEVIVYEQVPGWRTLVTDGFGAVVAAEADLQRELGEAAATALNLEAAVTLQLEPYRGHVLAVAERSA